MERKAAIRLIWHKSKFLGWDSAELHQQIGKLKMVRFDRISCCSGRELSLILNQLFNVQAFVEDSKAVKYLKYLSKQDGNREKLIGLIKHWDKQSVYQLNNKQLGFAIGYLLNEAYGL
ncbi:MAG: hypothetical protein WC155_08780 [Candidatus Cloacimonadales bacterium]|nr:hypothetical protein [Methanolobus sp.]